MTPQPPSRRNDERIISDADVEAIVARLEVSLRDRFYKDLGRGVWAIVWKMLLGALLIAAGYGASKGG